MTADGYGRELVTLAAIFAIVVIASGFYAAHLVVNYDPGLSTESQPPGPSVEPQALAWCDDHDGELVMVGDDDDPHCVMPTGDSVALMDRVEVAD